MNNYLAGIEIAGLIACQPNSYTKILGWFKVNYTVCIDSTDFNCLSGFPSCIQCVVDAPIPNMHKSFSRNSISHNIVNAETRKTFLALLRSTWKNIKFNVAIQSIHEDLLGLKGEILA
jgi:hypothetical protein